MPTIAQSLDIKHQQGALCLKIMMFVDMSSDHMDQLALDAAIGYEAYGQGDDITILNNDHWYMETDAKDHVKINAEDPKNHQLPFPSSVPLHLLGDVPRLQELRDKEYQLCVGQANDCLQGVREALGHLAWQFCDKVWKATSNKTATRSWASVKILSKELHHL